MAADQFDEISTAILSAFEESGKVQDQVFSGDPLFAKLNAIKGGKKKVAGGKDLKVNLRYGKNLTAQSYQGWDPLDRTPQKTVAHAIFPWAQYAVSIAIDEATILMDSSKEAIIDLVSDKTQEAVDSLEDLMTTHLYGNGTGNGGKDLLGLQALITATGTLGGIDRSNAAYSWWRCVNKDNANVALDEPMLTNVINTTRGPSGDPQKSGKVDMILMPQDLHESFEALLSPHLRIEARSRGEGGLMGGELGFDGVLRYKGADVMWSPNMPANTIYFLSTAYMGLRVLGGRDFKFSPFEKTLVAGQDGRVAYIFWMGNAVVTNSRRLGRAINVAA